MVILAGYTYENVRSSSSRATRSIPTVLATIPGQLGRHFMIKMFAHVDGFFPDMSSTATPAPRPRGLSWTTTWLKSSIPLLRRFLGGATLGAENQFLPIQISRETLPPGTTAVGQQIQGTSAAVAAFWRRPHPA